MPANSVAENVFGTLGEEIFIGVYLWSPWLTLYHRDYMLVRTDYTSDLEELSQEID